MNVLSRTLGFSLGLIAVFTLFTHALPQVEGEAPAEAAIPQRSMTLDEFVSFGAELFHNKGACTLCHRPPPAGRAPEIEGIDMVAVGDRRLADPAYAGEAQDAVGYILESMVDPGRYVVPGWGQKGSGDRISPMPAVDKPPIGLTSLEMDAIIAFLQAKDGHEVTVAPPSTAPADAGVAVSPVEVAESLESILEKHACSACHDMVGTERRVGPGLGDIGSRMTRDQIRRSILEPNAEVAEGYPPAMPADFADKMTVRELEAIVGYLSGSRG